MGPENVITDREVLPQPPAGHLAHQLQNAGFPGSCVPRTRSSGGETGPASVQYLVLDELHTYDGAQGSDVACLIRRLKAKTEIRARPHCAAWAPAPRSPAMQRPPSRNSCRSLRPCSANGSRTTAWCPRTGLQMSEYLGDQETYDELPVELRELRPLPDDTIERFIDRQCSLWFAQTGLDEIEVGEQLRQHAFLRTVLMRAGGKIMEWSKLVDGVAKWDPAFEALATDDRDAMLRSFLSLVSYAPPPHRRPQRTVPQLPGTVLDSRR